jgi:hypothetical protein
MLIVSEWWTHAILHQQPATLLLLPASESDRDGDTDNREGQKEQ